jgi:hypothetical protein
MLLLRAAFLAFLVCFHVIGAAVLFRRLFPRESPWLGFFVPTLAVMFVFNFAEHFIALPNLGWLLPFTLLGLLSGLMRPGYSWDGLRLPGILFVVIFFLALVVRCLDPGIHDNGEGPADFARILDFSLGDKLPPTDSWCPPYDHGGYYTFQHYGASLLTRLFSVDLGTGYNISFVLLNALTALAGAAMAWSIGGRRTWISVATIAVLLAEFTGSAPILVVMQWFGMSHLNLGDAFHLSVDLNENWDNPQLNPFSSLLAHDAFHQTQRLFTPMYDFYFPEFHANLGGHFMVLASLFMAQEASRTERSNWPWIALVLLPVATLITSTWFFIIVFAISFGGFAVALLMGRRPQNWQFVILAATAGLVLIWPSVGYLIEVASTQKFIWTPASGRTALDVFLLQWWPIYVPWLLLCFVRLGTFPRFLHVLIAVLFVFVEFVTVGDRGLTIEKMWGGLYGMGLVTLWPLVFSQRLLVFRFLTVLFLVVSAGFILIWAKMTQDWVDWDNGVLHLQGDSDIQVDPQKKRLLQVMKQLHAATILSGKSEYSYNQAPEAVGFSENRCYIAWFYQEFQCGHGGEAEYRDKMSNRFFAGTIPDPLAFLQAARIDAVLVWPDDTIPDPILDQLKSQLAPAYDYIDCKGDGPNNAGIFMPRHAVPTLPTTPPAPATP